MKKVGEPYFGRGAGRGEKNNILFLVMFLGFSLS
jgi:hypothetical protein